MTKDELRGRLESGERIEDLFQLRPGQECAIFKADAFQTGGEIIYIPDVWLNEIATDRPLTGCEIDDALYHCCTGDDFVSECDGDVQMAERLFWYCDWQHPSAAYPEVACNEWMIGS